MCLQAQVLSEAAANKRLGKVTHRKASGVPVMFFGTHELAWVGSQDITGFKQGIEAGYLTKGKHKSFLKACSQVGPFTAAQGQKSWLKNISVAQALSLHEQLAQHAHAACVRIVASKLLAVKPCAGSRVPVV